MLAFFLTLFFLLPPLSIMNPSYRTLDQPLANPGLEGVAQKRKWEAKRKKKSIDSNSSGSGISYDDPIVKATKLRASTAPPSHLPTRILPILPGPKLAQWAACRDEIFNLLKKDEFEIRSLNLLNVNDASREALRVTRIIEIESTKKQSRWKGTIISNMSCASC